MNKMLLLLLFLTASSCVKVSKKDFPVNVPVNFDPLQLESGMSPVKQVRGQLLYIPIYSNIPYQIDTVKFDMSAFLTIHNTDLFTRIRLTKVLYFNQEGKIVNNCLKDSSATLTPLATKEFYIPYEDQGGTGANFLVEWVADTLVNEPLVEAVSTCLKANNTVAVLSQGKVLREKK